MADVAVDISSLLQTTTCTVIQTIDAAKLEALLKWLVDKCTRGAGGMSSAPGADVLGSIQEQIDNMRRENTSLKGELDGLKSQLAEQRAQKTENTDTGNGAQIGSTDGVIGKLTELEATLQEMKGQLGDKADRTELDALLKSGADLSGAAAPDVEAAAEATAAVVGADGAVDTSALLDTLQRHGSELAALKGRLAVMEDRMGNKADGSALDNLKGEIRSLRSRLEGSSAPVTTSAPPAASTNDNADTITAFAHAGAGGGAGGDNDVLLVQLQESLHALKGQVNILLDLPARVERLNGLPERVDLLEVKLAAGLGAPSAADESARSAAAAASSAAVEAVGSLADVQPLLKDLYGQMADKADRSALDTLASRVAELTLQLQGKPDAAALTTKADLSALDALTQQLAAVAEASGRTLPVIIAPTSGQAPVSDESGKHALTQLRDLHAAQGQFNTRLDELWKLYGDLQQSVAAAAAATRVLPPVAVAAAAAAADAAPAAAVQAAVVAIEQYDDAALRGVVAQMSAQLHALTQALQDNERLASLELALNAKADVDELDSLRNSLATKADASTLTDLQMALASKADVSAIDGLKLQMALAGGVAGGEGSNNNAVMEVLQSLVADKATKAELDALCSLLGGKATADEVAALRAAVDGMGTLSGGASSTEVPMSALASKADTADLEALRGALGDACAELDALRARMAALSSTRNESAASSAPSTSGQPIQAELSGSGMDAASKALTGMARDVQVLKDNMDTLAHATNVLAVGLDNARASNTGEMGSSFSFNGPTGAGGSGGGAADGAGSAESRSSRGAYERLVRLLGSGAYRHKMDAFDLRPLHAMAAQVASLEATVKSPSLARMAAAPDVGARELERQLKRLATDMRIVKERMQESGLLTARRDPGDHAMLAAKPIQGYRCLACDRPLEGLDVRAGPYIPTHQMPTSQGGPPQAFMEPNMRNAPLGSVPGGSGPMAGSTGNGQGAAYGPPPARMSKPGQAGLSPENSSNFKKTTDRDVRGVQNWYADTKGLPAEMLPKADVGPHLPPGGWKGGAPPPNVLGKPQGSLPSIHPGSPQSMRSPKVSEPGFGVMQASSMPGVPLPAGEMNLPPI